MPAECDWTNDRENSTVLIREFDFQFSNRLHLQIRLKISVSMSYRPTIQKLSILINRKPSVFRLEGTPDAGSIKRVDGARWVGVSKNKLFWPGIGRRPWRDKRRNYAKRSPRRLANDCKCGGKKDGSASPSRATFQEAVPRPCLV